MAKCPECPPEGAPEWVVTFSDMCTLLLCFFVLLVSMAKTADSKLEAASGYMRERMGLMPNNNGMESKDTKLDGNEVSNDIDETNSIDEGKRFNLGDREMFDQGSAVPKMTPELMAHMLKVSERIRGIPNIVEVRGHTSPNEFDKSVFRDDMDLSLERARSIRDVLVNNCHIQQSSIRLVGCGSNENTAAPLTEMDWKNRRVEIRVTEKNQDMNPNTRVK